MEIVLATMSLDLPGGVQSYLLTIAPQLERLGHEVTLHAPRLGAMADLARSRGLRVADGEATLPPACDAVLAQDAATGLAMADRYPAAVHALVVHGAEFDVHLPPALEGVFSCAIALNDAVERRLRAMAAPPRVVRLRQPVDAAGHPAVGVARERPERVLMLGNYLQDAPRDALARACEEAGLDWRQVGQQADTLADPASAINEADIVIGQGRSVLDAMARGRAAWVYGPSCGDGWVTAESYPALEADGFRGRATDALLHAETFRRDLTGYRATMGSENRRLVVLRHSAYEHAIELVETLGAGVGDPPRADAPLREIARLVRTQFDAQSRIDGVAVELVEAHARLGATHEQLVAANDERAALRAENDELHRRFAELVASRRWRLAALAARPLEALRRRGPR